MNSPHTADSPDELAQSAAFLRRLARGLVGDPHLAEDVVQDAFVAALERPPVARVALPRWLARPPSAPHVLWIGTYRSDEAESSRFLQAWAAGKQQLDVPHTDCEVGALSQDECTQLVIDIVGADDESLRRRAVEMAEESAGNPLLLSELASCYDPEAAASQPMHIKDVVERKLGLLPPDARALLDIVSVSGQALPLEEAARTGITGINLSNLGLAPDQA